MNALLHLLLCQSCRSLRNASLSSPHIPFLGLIKRSHRVWLSMMMSSEGPLTLTTPFILLSIVHSSSAHSRRSFRRMLRRWWTPASISWSHGERHERPTPPAQFLFTPGVCLPYGSELPQSLWVALNRLRTGVGRFGTCLFRWGMLDTPKCICGRTAWK